MSYSESARKKNHQPVRVCIRQRPFTENEISLGCSNIIQHITTNELSIKTGVVDKRYTFDRVFSEETSQKEIYEFVVSPLISCIISGYNCTVFAYGQTGTGKTYTMVGNNSEDFETSSIGLIPRSAAHLFSELDNAKIEYTVRISFIEIYNEEVRDLISNSSIPVKIYEDPDNKGSVLIRGVKEITVLNTQELYDWLKVGLNERQTASTNMNRNSSRSHSIFIFSVLTRHLTVDGDELVKTGKLCLVDLAGSENLGRSGSTEIRAREAGNINKSLLTLGKVIKSLAQKAQHVPYRDSKLTRILQDSLGGKTKTCMIATISAAANVLDETLSTLDYAQVARNVSNCPQINESRKQTNLVKTLKEEIGRLRKELAIARAGEGFYISRELYDKMCENLENLRSEVNSNKNQLEDLIKQNSELELENYKKEEQLNKLRKSYEDIQLELEEKSYLCKRDEFVLSYLEKRENDLRNAAEQLWKVCQISTKHETLFCKKYENQCEVSLKNAETARNAYQFFGNSLKLFQNASKDHTDCQKYSFNKVHANVACLREDAWKMCKRLTEYSRKIDEESEKENLKIDENVLHREFESTLDGLVVPSMFEMQRKTVENLEKYNESKMLEMESMTTRCVNAMKQLLNDYTMCVKDIMDSQSLLIQSLKNGISNDEAVITQAIEGRKNESRQLLKSFISNINEKLIRQVNKTKQLSNLYSDEIESIKSQFTVESENKIKDIMIGLENAEHNQNNYMKSIRNFSDETLRQIKKDIDENIQSVVHAGDTPVRQNYVLPTKIEKCLPKTVLYREFENNHN